MKMIRNNNYVAVLVAAVWLLGGGCTGSLKQPDEYTEKVNFSVSVEGRTGNSALVKAGVATIENLTSFKVSAFDDSEESTSQFIPTDTEVLVIGGIASTTYIWTKPYKKRFYAYANIPGPDAGVTPSYSGQTLFYTVPLTADKQNDILLGTYNGDGGPDHKATLLFRHPLSKISFKVGTMLGINKISEIRIKGVYGCGYLVQNYDGQFGKWFGMSTIQDVSQSVGLNNPVGDSPIGDVPFMLIPQSGDINVELDVDTSETENMTLSGTISGAEWITGQATEYSISYTPGKSLNFTAEVNPWGSGVSEDVSLNKPTGPSSDFWVDLGMKSVNGYPLYVSRRNVSSIINGRVMFADNDTSVGNEIDVHEYSEDDTFESVSDGVTCRIMHPAELHSLCQTQNTTFKVNDGIIIATSNINGKELILPTELSSGNGIFDEDGFLDGGFALFYNDGPLYVRASGNNPRYIRMVYEDTDGEISASQERKIYSVGATSAMRMSLSYFLEHQSERKNRNVVVYRHTGCFTFLLRSVFDNNYIGFYNVFPEGMEMQVEGGDGFNINKTRFSVKDMDQPTTAEVTITDNGTPFANYLLSFEPACFLKGTLITLADGSRKPVEEITYADELKVWNFDKGCFDSAKVLWLTRKGLKNDHYIKCKFSDGTVLNVTGRNSHHKLYNCDERYFQGVTKMEPGTRVFTENGIVTLVSKEWIEEDVEYYNVITDRHINCFANGVLTSARYNNTYPIDEDMRFVKDGRKVRPYKEFKAVGISREWYDGLRLGEQTDSLESIRKYIDKVESQMLDKPKTEKSGVCAGIWNWIKGVFNK